MRLSTDSDRSEESALATLGAAILAGVDFFDTAPSYALGESDQHHNERLIAKALSLYPGISARVATKGGIHRVGSKWVVDGRAKSIQASCQESLEVLSRIDLYFLHAVDTKVPFRTSLRALAGLKSKNMVTGIGVSNVSLSELDAAIDEAGIDAVQIALSPFDDTAARSGVLARAIEKGLQIVVHSPLGGPKRARRLPRDEVLAPLAKRRGISIAELFLAFLYGLSQKVIPIPGATRPETARTAFRAARLSLDAEEVTILDQRFLSLSRAARGLSNAVPLASSNGEVVMVMGIQGAGKSTYVTRYTNDGYALLNRDSRGGTLSSLARELDARMKSGERRLVVDNTYPSRAERARIIEKAHANGASVKCIWIDVPLGRAQWNVALRLVRRYGSLPDGDGLRELAKTDPQAFLPTAQWRFRRALEEPLVLEGFRAVERIDPHRHADFEERPGVMIASDCADAAVIAPLRTNGLETAPILIFAWAPNQNAAAARAELSRRIEALDADVSVAVCNHPGGPPTCWCRPPLPGLFAGWAIEKRIDTRQSLVVGRSSAHRALADAVGARFVDVS